MLANLQRNVRLWLTEKTGLTAAVLIFGCMAAVAAFLGFIFLCVSGYAWAAAELGPIFGGLASAGLFFSIGECCFSIGSSSRRRTQHRAALERAGRAHERSLLFNPKTLQIVMQARRYIGWQRLILLALIGFLATQFAREHRRGEKIFD
jgi:hypothetical protein